MKVDRQTTSLAGPDRLAIRSFDLAASLLALIFLSPLLVAVAAAIKIEDRGPVMFRQDRTGLGGTVFRIFKFRSMVMDAENKGTGLFIDGENDSRITRVGRFIRKTSIDELPQLLNILRGEMSLVGPRPGLPSHAEDYSDRQMRRLDVRPGLTGWAQVNGRNSLTWPQRIELDIDYIERRSFLFNLSIILRTVPVLMGGGGHYAPVGNFAFEENTPVEEAVCVPEGSVREREAARV